MSLYFDEPRAKVRKTEDDLKSLINTTVSHFRHTMTRMLREPWDKFSTAVRVLPISKSRYSAPSPSVNRLYTILPPLEQEFLGVLRVLERGALSGTTLRLTVTPRREVFVLLSGHEGVMRRLVIRCLASRVADSYATKHISVAVSTSALCVLTCDPAVRSSPDAATERELKAALGTHDLAETLTVRLPLILWPASPRCNPYEIGIRGGLPTTEPTAYGLIGNALSYFVSYEGSGPLPVDGFLYESSNVKLPLGHRRHELGLINPYPELRAVLPQDPAAPWRDLENPAPGVLARAIESLISKVKEESATEVQIDHGPAAHGQVVSAFERARTAAARVDGIAAAFHLVFLEGAYRVVYLEALEYQRAAGEGVFNDIDPDSQRIVLSYLLPDSQTK